jgi:hypothetical protein
MRTKIAKMLLLGMFLLTGLSLFAQDKYIEVNVPFPFIVMGENFPAGTYTIRQMDSTELNGYTIRSKDGRLYEDFLTEETQSLHPAKKTTLLFNEVGSQYFLERFSTAGDEIGQKLPKSKAEKNAEALNPMASNQKIVEARYYTRCTPSPSRRRRGCLGTFACP